MQMMPFIRDEMMKELVVDQVAALYISGDFYSAADRSGAGPLLNVPVYNNFISPR